MILMGTNPFLGPLEVLDPENRDFLCPEMATSEASAIWAQKNRNSLCPGHPPPPPSKQAFVHNS
jgi:hypothetical protein